MKSLSQYAGMAEAQDAVLEAAAKLDIGEFELFALAHRWWFGRRADTSTLERAFAAYMFQCETPPWARHFAREVLRQARAGALDRRALGLDAMAPPSAPRHGWAYVGATGLAFALFLACLLDTTYDPRTSAPLARQFACEAGPGLAAITRFAEAVAGRAAEDCSPRR